ncbi:MAG: GHKL domain-containing protein [Bacteroidales bacterium]|nr:GHKL domain-containing protein [Bacteroidales bacterium]
MVFNRFRIITILLSVSMGLTSFIFVWALDKDDLIIGKFLIVVLWFIELQTLIRFVNKTNLSLSLFLEALKSSDFIPKQENTDSIGKLNLSYNSIIEIVKKARLDQQTQYLYFQYTLEHLSTGIISYKKDGTVDLFNKSAQNILGIEKLKNIEDINQVKEKLSIILKKIDEGKNKLIHINSTESEKRILVKASRFILMNEEITLLSLQDIKAELDIEELNAWQKLIRVLTHEIMNSIGPMKSITSSTLKLFRSNDITKRAIEINDEIIEDTVLGLQTIQERNYGLMNFVKSYKKLLKVPVPTKQRINIEELCQNLEQLFKDDFSRNQIETSFYISKEIGNINADETLLTQVLINLIKNAIEALNNTKDKIIEVVVHTTDLINYIEVSDNGKGMSDEVKSQIFIPFYTTKKEGDGIGLSLSRQIILAHEGDITVESELEKGSKFTVKI